MTGAILNLVFGKRLNRETSRYLDSLANTQTRKSAANQSRLLEDLNATPGRKITLGTTSNEETVAVPLDELGKAHGIVTGGSGSGKTRFGLLLIRGFIDQ